MKLQVNLNVMRRCSLLFGFLFCINHLSWLDAVGVQNWSSTFNNIPWKNWVVLVAGTNAWENYRHQADVFHAYQIVRKNKVPAENIITFAYDDIANNPKNPFKGKVFHDYLHEDVYQGVEIDYRGKDVTRDNFAKVLKGDQKLAANKKKVLESGPDDNVFIFFSGHAGCRGVERAPRPHAFEKKVQQIGALDAVELNGLLAHMHSKKKYNKLVLYVEACQSGSLFRNILPKNVGIYVTTSANEDGQSWSVFCSDKYIDVCLASEYAYAWIGDSEYHDLKTHTLDQQYEEVKKRTAYSHVMRYGEMAMKSLPVGKFQGHYDLPMYRNDSTIQPNAVDRKPSLQAHLFSKSRRLMEAATHEQHETARRKLHRASQLGHIVKETIRDIVRDVKTQPKPTLKDMSKTDELMCFKAVFDQFRTHCFTIQQVPEVAQHTRHLMELCKAGYKADILIESVHNVCS
ncbi:hypothetical protein T265_11830 [Opisthorchis viverrini]|uniref:Hemoglobinase n=1 Tax=Opisthorchis viverrini TaxID=6198 RepID=A0A074Z806_OPIVI|nr:hypothetical protein T265_11830 [Opisthorchis viverrini]KER19375.1 hypothetical protein T265_11830 [Opisthorchis viverrini]